MKLNLIIVLLLVSAHSFSQDYLEYYKNISDADYCYKVEKNFTKSFNMYCSAFENFSPVFYDYINGAEVALLSGNKDSCFNWIRSYFKFGCSNYLIINSVVFKNNFSSLEWSLVDEYHEQGKSYFYKNADLNLIEKISYLYSADVYLGTEPIFEKDSLKWSIRNKVFSNNISELVTLIKENGYPGYSKIGYYSKNIRTILLHANIESKNDSINICFLKEILIEELKKGQISPNTYVILYDNMVEIWQNKKPQIYGNWTNRKTNSFYEIKDICEVDERRKSIGLTSLRKYAEIREVIPPTEYILCK